MSEEGDGGRWALRCAGCLEILVIELPGMPATRARLTPSEEDIVERLLRGASNAAIARARGTSERTVANQLQRIYRKHGVFSRAELIARLSA